MYKKGFKLRMNELLRESGLSAKSFADKCSVSRQSMQYYLSGERMPDSSCLLKICKACSVSADWLLSLSDVRTLAVDARNAVEYTGLPESMINTIKAFYDKRKIQALVDLVEDKEFPHLLDDYNLFLDLLSQINTYEQGYSSDSDFRIDLDKNMVTVNLSTARTLFKSRIVNDMSEICNYKEHQHLLGLFANETTRDEEENF